MIKIKFNSSTSFTLTLPNGKFRTHKSVFDFSKYFPHPKYGKILNEILQKDLEKWVTFAIKNNLALYNFLKENNHDLLEIKPVVRSQYPDLTSLHLPPNTGFDHEYFHSLRANQPARSNGIRQNSLH